MTGICIFIAMAILIMFTVGERYAHALHWPCGVCAFILALVAVVQLIEPLKLNNEVYIAPMAVVFPIVAGGWAWTAADDKHGKVLRMLACIVVTGLAMFVANVGLTSVSPLIPGAIAGAVAALVTMDACAVVCASLWGPLVGWLITFVYAQLVGRVGPIELGFGESFDSQAAAFAASLALYAFKEWALGLSVVRLAKRPPAV